MSIAFLFPGQGSQTVGMLHNLPQHSAVDHTLEEVSDVLGVDVLKLDSAESLQSTVSVQLALLASGVAVARTLEEKGIIADAVAGLSAGAFGAAVHCGAICLAESVQLVRERAERMSTLNPKGYGLAAIVGLTEEQVSALILASQTESDPVYLGSINAPRQIVIAGSHKGMQRVLEAARRRGASRAEALPISVPSHCPLLRPIADALKERIPSLRMQKPRMVYMSNVKGRALRTSNPIVEDLVNNIAHPVRWHDAMIVLGELGSSMFLEMPPGHVLTDLVKNSMPRAISIAVNRASIKHLCRLVRKSSNDSAPETFSCRRTL